MPSVVDENSATLSTFRPDDMGKGSGKMKAIRIAAFSNSLDNLKLETIPDLPLLPGEVKVQVMAACINPSDVKNVQGKMEGTTLPRIPGRDFAGIVVEGPPNLAGREVWGTGGDVGFTRDGSHAEFITSRRKRRRRSRIISASSRRHA
jgi:NADPH:quinone reductase-like Zn-dependent oxidoreductase